MSQYSQYPGQGHQGQGYPGQGYQGQGQGYPPQNHQNYPPHQPQYACLLIRFSLRDHADPKFAADSHMAGMARHNRHPTSMDTASRLLRGVMVATVPRRVIMYVVAE